MPAATTERSVPAFASKLAGETEDSRKKILRQVHPDYAANVGSWNVLLDAFEGCGGFLDGSYLWPYPREAEADFNARRAMARYHNYLETLVDLYVRFMFTQNVRRDSTSPDYNDWLENVDGAGTKINDLLKRFAAMSLVNGHAGMLIDKSPDEPAGPTQADDQGRVVARVFTAPNIPDWRHDGDTLVGVKLLEAGPTPSLVEEMPADTRQFLLWDMDGWARFDANGNLVAYDKPAIPLGLVPLVVLRPKQSHLSEMLGRALVSNANVIRALFNRAAEEDQVLREQAFSVMTVEVPPEGDVDQAKQQLGNVIGSAKALVVKGVIKYETPDQNVPQTIRDNMSYLVQEIYRAAHVRYRRDSLAAESAESIRIQYTELNEMLQGFSKALTLAERQIARCYFAWTTPTAEAAQAAFEKAKVEAEYPTEFFVDDLMTDLQAWAEAVRMNLGPTMTRRIKKRAVRRVDPDIPVDELKTIDEEIDKQPEDVLIPPIGFDAGVSPDTGQPQDGTP